VEVFPVVAPGVRLVIFVAVSTYVEVDVVPVTVTVVELLVAVA
jgi:hypothetical protein